MSRLRFCHRRRSQVIWISSIDTDIKVGYMRGYTWESTVVPVLPRLDRYDSGVLASRLCVYTQTRGRIGILKEMKTSKKNVYVSVEVRTTYKGRQAIYPNKILDINRVQGQRRCLSWFIEYGHTDRTSVCQTFHYKGGQQSEADNYFDRVFSECWCLLARYVNTAPTSS
jgi:hypothetical protein